jgi:GxxExxY protein
MKKSLSENELAKILVDIFFRIDQKFGPGLFERVYEELVCFELDKLGLNYKRQQEVKLMHEGNDLGVAYRADLIVQDLVIVELKSVDELHDIHFKQVLTYLKLAECKLGLLVNFNVPLIRWGIKRIANGI